MLPITNPTYHRLHKGIVLAFLFLLGTGVVQAQCTLACTQNVQISLDQVGKATVTPDFITPYAAANCPNDLELTVFSPQNTPISNTLDCSRIGQVLSVRVRHTPTNNLCYGNVSVQDYLPPVLTCPEKMISCSADTSIQAVGYPSVSDNCTSIQQSGLLATDVYTDLPCFSMHNGQTVTAKIDRTWQTSDSHGNSSSCVQQIYIKRNTLSDVTFPVNRDGFAAPFLVCGQNAADLQLTGQPIIDGNPVYPNGSCEIVIGHSDQSNIICGTAGKRIIRNWTASDYCANTFTIHVQVIEVKDTTPPTLTLPPNLTVGTQTGCTATVTLPPATLQDACSSVSSTVSWPFGTGLGPFSQVPVGSHIAVYTATDACNNKTTKSLTVIVVDNQPPTAICKGSIQVSLPTNGQSEIPAQSIDNGSFDNCSGILLEISRDTLAFAARVPISCTDVGRSFKAYLRIKDGQGLINMCQSTITVNETSAPFLACPNDVSLSCKDNPLDLNLTGQALASDNCGLDTLTFQDSTALNTCHVGQVFRRWKALDLSGNKSTCQQKISLQAVNSIAISFPKDTTLTTCTDTSRLSPNLSGWPLVAGVSCGTVSLDYTDVMQYPSPFGCFSIERTWKVRDVCNYDPNTGAGYWTKIQRITVQDHTAPVLWLPADVSIAAPNCAAAVVLQSASAADCTTFSIKNNSSYADSLQANASGLYPIGVHTVWFTATDVCGNSSSKSLKITVADTTAPSLSCKQNTPINLGSSGKIALNGLALLSSVSDNCTSQAALNISTSPDSLSCTDIGSKNVIVSVKDAAQNKSTCTATLVVVDNANVCSAGSFVELEGRVTTVTGLAIKGIPISLVSDGYSDMQECASNGKFLFADVPTGASYRIEASNDRKPTLGVNTYDLLLIMKHMLGIQPITQPLTLMAADANNSKTITPSDIIFLRKLILGIEQAFPNGLTWSFVPKSFVFQNPDNPFADNPPSSISLNAQLAMDSLDFWGVKTGDLDNSANPALARSPKDTVYIELNDMQLKAGEKTRIPVRLPTWSNLDGFQFALQSKDAQMMEVELSASKTYFNSQNFNESLMADNELRASWNAFPNLVNSSDTVLFYLELMPEKNAWLSDVLFINENSMDAEAYSTDLNKEETLSRMLLHFDGAKKIRRGTFGMLEVFPNPILTTTSLSFDMPVATTATLQISNTLGEFIFSKEIHCLRGQNTVQLNRSNFGAPGYYSFFITSPETRTLVGKGIVIEEK